MIFSMGQIWYFMKLAMWYFHRFEILLWFLADPLDNVWYRLLWCIPFYSKNRIHSERVLDSGGSDRISRMWLSISLMQVLVHSLLLVEWAKRHMTGEISWLWQDFFDMILLLGLSPIISGWSWWSSHSSGDTTYTQMLISEVGKNRVKLTCIFYYFSIIQNIKEKSCSTLFLKAPL